MSPIYYNNTFLLKETTIKLKTVQGKEFSETNDFFYFRKFLVQSCFVCVLGPNEKKVTPVSV